jgi:signal peptidase I
MSETDTASLPDTATKAKPQKSETADFMQFLLKLALFVFVLRSFIFAPFNIPSESMLPRLMIGDYLLVSKWSYGYSRYSLPFGIPLIPGRVFASVPERGDVVVFKWPGDQSTDYIKRVIGQPGDLVQVKGGTLFLNGAAIPKKRIANFIEPMTPNSACIKEKPQFRDVGSGGVPVCSYPRFIETLPSGKSYQVLDLDVSVPDDTEVFAVPAGHLFVMGDNRDRSADSRVPLAQLGVDILPQVNLVGKAWFSVFSTDGTANWLLPWTWVSAARWDRIGEGF